LSAPHSYIEHLPAAPLRPFVECLWTRSDAAVGLAHAHRVLPDGCMDIVFRLQGPGQSSWARVVGTMSRPLEVSGAPPARFLGIRFLPGKARLFLDLHAAELTDGDADLSSFWGRAGSELLARVEEARDLRRGVLQAQQALLSRLPRRAGEPRVDRAVTAILETRGAAAVQSLACEAGVSRQHLNNTFRDWVGVSPKVFSRVVRFRALLARIGQQRPVRWAELALEAGYFDQAHLIADFREFSGQSPEAFLRSRLSSG